MLFVESCYNFLQFFSYGCSNIDFRFQSLTILGALGQYLIDQTFLSLTHPTYKVYLAVGHKIYEKFFAQNGIELILQKYQFLLLVIDLKKEEIIKWIS